MTDERIVQAQELRDEGKPYRAIANVLGVTPMTIYFDLNPEAKERNHLCTKQYHADHKEEIDTYKKQYNADHKEKRSAYGKQYCRIHKEEKRTYDQQYSQTHKFKYAVRSAKRRALIAEATIGDMDQIKEIYCIAQEEPKVRCYLCGKLIPIGERAVDHIFPISKDGTHRPSNLAVAHKKCNRKKSAKLPEEIGLLL